MSQKGFYNGNKDWSRKIKDFFRESGFYIMIVVGLCVLAIGAVYFTTNHLISSPEDFDEDIVPYDTEAEGEYGKDVVISDEPGSGDEAAIDQLQNPDRRIDYEAVTDPKDGEDDLVAENDDSDNDKKDEKDKADVETMAKPTAVPAEPTKAPDKPSTQQKAEAEKGEDAQEVIKLFETKPKFIMPVEGNICMDYAMDRLLYSKTLDEWRTHSGIDIEAPRGEVVKAAADGYVKEIKEDPCYGITITVDHENGYKTIYSNLASTSMVSVNQKVKAGDPISSVGNTAIFECMDPPHLHFEVYKDDKLIDPKTLLPVAKDGTGSN